MSGKCALTSAFQHMNTRSNKEIKLENENRFDNKQEKVREDFRLTHSTTRAMFA